VFESADKFADTLRLLAPGFVLMKTFYFFGLRTRRSDAQWALWSLITAAAISAAAEWMGIPKNDRLWYAFLIAVGGGVILALVWNALAELYPALQAGESIRAWDIVFQRPHWVQVDLVDKRTVAGYVRLAASSVDADEHLDLYIGRPRLVVNGQYVELPDAEGMLVRAEQISSVLVYDGEDAQRKNA
jgi:hypothetical protein